MQTCEVQESHHVSALYFGGQPTIDSRDASKNGLKNSNTALKYKHQRVYQYISDAMFFILSSDDDV